ncbi:septum formation initiator family protein [Patescibacteria group bacterium]|nr:septum formation initiator family protein [Patescibacteria group bacterium]
MNSEGLENLKKKKKTRSQIFLISLALVFSYMVFATGETLWQNYEVNREIAKLKVEIVQLQEQGQDLKYLIAYRGTESFKEREARRKLGYKKPGEKVLAITSPLLDNVGSGQAKDMPETQAKTKITNPQKWLEYIFG